MLQFLIVGEISMFDLKKETLQNKFREFLTYDALLSVNISLLGISLKSTHSFIA